MLARTSVAKMFSSRDLFERDTTGRLVLGQIDHNAQGVPTLSRNQHI